MSEIIVRCGRFFFTFTDSLRSLRTKLKPKASREVFCRKKTNFQSALFLSVASNLLRAEF